LSFSGRSPIGTAFELKVVEGSMKFKAASFFPIRQV